MREVPAGRDDDVAEAGAHLGHHGAEPAAVDRLVAAEHIGPRAEQSAPGRQYVVHGAARAVQVAEPGLTPEQAYAGAQLVVLVDVDAAKVERIIENLLVNARRHTPAGTAVHIRVEGRSNGVVLVIEDEGPGIPDAESERVFERFYRVDKARARSQRDPGGTGLGLAIVHRIVTDYGGDIQVNSHAGSGTTVSVRLPAHAAVTA